MCSIVARRGYGDGYLGEGMKKQEDDYEKERENDMREDTHEGPPYEGTRKKSMTTRRNERIT